jgi:predicted ATPase/DNA-binding winged helix-turn-helix (wHTH) protein
MTRWPHRETVRGQSEAVELQMINPVVPKCAVPRIITRMDAEVPVYGATVRRSDEDSRGVAQQAYATKPLEIVSVTSALRDVGQRQGGFASDLARWELDLQRRELHWRGIAVPLGRRAFEIIEVLAEAGGELVTKDTLMHSVWPGATVNDNALQVHISAIRKTLGSSRGLLKTESGRGYRLLGSWSVRHRQPATSWVAPSCPRRKNEEAGATNLPIVVNSLIGRSEAELALRKLLSAHPVVTLTGPGGIGKTSLALHVARTVLAEFNDGGWLVELASLSDPNLVPSMVSSVLGLELGEGETSTVAVAQAIADRNCLLVLDNCEHVIDAIADLAEMLVRFSPRTRVLTTSREALRVEGEFVYRVLPLDVPSATEEEPGTILRCGAIELFVAKVTALNSDLILHVDDLSFIAAICRHLDGIPLAIEFAATRAAVLGVQVVAAGLANRFALLTAGRRTALPRHQSLRASLDWSYDLLSETEQLLLRHLAVFPSSFKVDTASAVLSDSIFASSAMIAAIADLVEKSLVTLDKSDTTPAWFLLNTTRAYALEKLIQQKEFDGASQRHAVYSRGLLQTD